LVRLAQETAPWTVNVIPAGIIRIKMLFLATGMTCPDPNPLGKEEMI
jgi:hypothetical protein